MAASAFSLYNKAKKKIGNGTIVLGTTALRLRLYTSASNAATLTLSGAGSLTNECTGGGYASGKSLSGEAWTVGASAKSYKFDATDVVFTASGSSLTNVKFAVVATSASPYHLLCYSKLSSSQFTVTSPNTLTVVFNALGLFEMH